MARKRSLRTNSIPMPTIQAAFEQFQRQNTIKNLSQGTIEFYSAKSKYFFTFLGDTEQCIDSITQVKVEEYIIWMKDKQLGDTSINTNLRMVRAFLYWCMERRYCPKCANFKVLETDEPCNECLTECAREGTSKPVKFKDKREKAK